MCSLYCLCSVLCIILGIKYIGELTPRTKDTLVSYGERLSVRIVAATLNKMGVPAQAFDSWTLGMLTSSEFGNAEVRLHIANTSIAYNHIHCIFNIGIIMIWKWREV